jgi:hypothetical protein
MMPDGLAIWTIESHVHFGVESDLLQHSRSRRLDSIILKEIGKGQYDWALQVGTLAYIWGIPIVTCWSDRLKKLCPIGLAQPDFSLINRFRHVRTLSTPGASEFVNAATDFLYSTAVIDLRNGPLRLTGGDFSGRWYGLQVLDAYMETMANIGTRTCGDVVPSVVLTFGDQQCDLTPDEWSIHSDTPFVYVVGRIAADAGRDLIDARRLQDALVLEPTDSDNRGPHDLADVLASLPLQNPDCPEALGFYSALAKVLAFVPPRGHEGMLLGLLRDIGIDPVRGFDHAALTEEVSAGLADAVPHARGILGRKLYTTGQMVDGWMWVTDIGNYGSDYIVRALVSQHGIWANVPEESLYVMARLDADGALLHGAHRYEIRFPPGQAPPVDAFWSISYYDEHGHLVAHPSGRTTVNSLYSSLSLDEDGAVTIEIGPHPPSEPQRASNWLPSHDGAFNLNLRCYNPRPAMLSMQYRVPAVRRVG